MRRVAAGVAALLVTAALAACSRGESPLAGCHLPSGATVLAIGDSLTRGQGGDGEGYAEQLQQRQQGPIGRYVDTSGKVPMREAAKERAEKRFDAGARALMPGRVSTDVLMQFAARRPDTVRIRKVELKTDTNNPTGSKDFKPKTVLVMEFFIEKSPSADPISVNKQLRDILGKLTGVVAVTPGESKETAEGIDVEHTVELNLHLDRETGE